jgi:hypothetical protein
LNVRPKASDWIGLIHAVIIPSVRAVVAA